MESRRTENEKKNNKYHNDCLRFPDESVSTGVVIPCYARLGLNTGEWFVLSAGKVCDEGKDSAPQKAVVFSDLVLDRLMEKGKMIVFPGCSAQSPARLQRDVPLRNDSLGRLPAQTGTWCGMT